MGMYRVLNIMDNTMSSTNQRIAVVELSEIEVTESGFVQGFGSTSFAAKGDKFVIDFHSPLTQLIIQAARNEDSVEIDLNNFTGRHEIKNGKRELIRYHNNVVLL